MFKYNEFPIIKKKNLRTDDHSTSHPKTFSKSFRCKSHHPYKQTKIYSMVNVIDIETNSHLTLKTIFKNRIEKGGEDKRENECDFSKKNES